MTFNTYYEQLMYETGALKRLSRDDQFTEYLSSVESRAVQDPSLSQPLRSEMIRNFMIYQDRMAAAGIMQKTTYLDYVYPGMEMPIVAEAEVAPAPAPAPVYAQTVEASVAQPEPAVQPKPVPEQPQPVFAQPTSAFVQPQPQPAFEQPQVQPDPIPRTAPTAPVKEKKPGAEYAVGGIVLSILGTALILTGFVMLAVNFFDSFLQGMSLYLVCAVLMLVSELVIRRLVKKLSYVFSGLAVAGFFVVTLINYFVLDLYNFWVTLIILFVLSCLTGVFGYFKKAFLFTVIGYCSVFLGFSLISSVDGDAMYLSLFGIMLFQTILWMIMPIEKRYGKAFSIIQIVGNMILVCASCTCSGTDNIFVTPDIDGLGLSIFNSFSFITLLTILFITGLRFYRKDEFGTFSKPVAQIILAAVSTAAYVICKLYAANQIFDELAANIELFLSALIFVLVGAAFVFFMKTKKIEMWQPVIFYVLFMSFFTVLSIREYTISSAGMLLVLGGAVCVAKFLKTPALKVCDLVLKIIFTIIASVVANGHPYEPAHYIMMAGLVLAIAAGSGFIAPSEIILTAGLIYTVCQLSTYRLWLILISGIVMLAVFVYHNVKYLRPKVILVFDILAMVTMVFVLGFLNHPFYKNDMVTTLLVFAFGLGTLIQYLQKSYGMFFAGKMMPIAVYLTYFVFVLRLKEAFVTSAILMAVALICVALGFLMKQKSVRIYGLVLSMFVCVKLVFFDVADAASLVKTIMYFVVGILALVIAGVYIVAEMLVNKKAQQAASQPSDN